VAKVTPSSFGVTMFIKVEDNPTGGPDNGEATWWKTWLNKKQEVSNKNTLKIQQLMQEKRELHDKMNAERATLGKLCEKFDTVTKQVAAEERSKHKTDHRRLEVEDKSSI
jgi:hypothetical protein